MEESPDMSAQQVARAEIVVDLAAIRHNVATLRELAAPARMMVVVKADGYGHGMVPAARAAREAGADWLGVATIDEALAPPRGRRHRPGRCAGSAFPASDYADAVAADVDVTAYTVAQLDEIRAGVGASGRPARLQLKIDTGLSRGGSTRPRPGRRCVAAARAGEQAGDWRVTGIWSHFACSDEPDHPANDAQEAAFRRCPRGRRGGRPAPGGAPPGQLRRGDPAALAPASTWSGAASRRTAWTPRPA